MFNFSLLAFYVILLGSIYNVSCASTHAADQNSTNISAVEVTLDNDLSNDFWSTITEETRLIPDGCQPNRQDFLCKFLNPNDSRLINGIKFSGTNPSKTIHEFALETQYGKTYKSKLANVSNIEKDKRVGVEIEISRDKIDYTKHQKIKRITNFLLKRDSSEILTNDYFINESQFEWFQISKHFTVLPNSILTIKTTSEAPPVFYISLRDKFGKVYQLRNFSTQKINSEVGNLYTHKFSVGGNLEKWKPINVSEVYIHQTKGGVALPFSLVIGQDHSLYFPFESAFDFADTPKLLRKIDNDQIGYRLGEISDSQTEIFFNVQLPLSNLTIDTNYRHDLSVFSLFNSSVRLTCEYEQVLSQCTRIQNYIKKLNLLLNKKFTDNEIKNITNQIIQTGSYHFKLPPKNDFNENLFKDEHVGMVKSNNRPLKIVIGSSSKDFNFRTNLKADGPNLRIFFLVLVFVVIAHFCKVFHSRISQFFNKGSEEKIVIRNSYKFAYKCIVIVATFSLFIYLDGSYQHLSILEFNFFWSAFIVFTSIFCGLSYFFKSSLILNYSFLLSFLIPLLSLTYFIEKSHFLIDAFVFSLFVFFLFFFSMAKNDE